ncbi:MAG TPA: hypothetical protein VHR66_01765 [Gemmataceae bacterium]|jgi:hypothetical protein|nr:hypothetical protein [Gemmataceae bacterium]
MATSELQKMRIRNQRYRYRVEIAGVAFIAMTASGVCGLLLTRGLERIMLGCILTGVLGILAIGAYGWLQMWDLRRGQLSEQRVTVGAVLWHRLLKLRRKQFGLAGSATPIIGLEWLLPARTSIRYLNLGEGIELDPPLARFPAEEVARIKFTPNPDEDYAESSTPTCAATVVMKSGREFWLIVDEADAGRLRAWAAAKGIGLCDVDGYRPRIPKPISEALRHE